MDAVNIFAAAARCDLKLIATHHNAAFTCIVRDVAPVPDVGRIEIIVAYTGPCHDIELFQAEFCYLVDKSLQFGLIVGSNAAAYQRLGNLRRKLLIKTAVSQRFSLGVVTVVKQFECDVGFERTVFVDFYTGAHRQGANKQIVMWKAKEFVFGLIVRCPGVVFAVHTPFGC